MRLSDPPGVEVCPGRLPITSRLLGGVLERIARGALVGAAIPSARSVPVAGAGTGQRAGRRPAAQVARARACRR